MFVRELEEVLYMGEEVSAVRGARFRQLAVGTEPSTWREREWSRGGSDW